LQKEPGFPENNQKWNERCGKTHAFMLDGNRILSKFEKMTMVLIPGQRDKTVRWDYSFLNEGHYQEQPRDRQQGLKIDIISEAQHLAP
jgi:hypothetical protein